ncbi:MAG TPA: AraC family transcriptional regulator [Sporichthyaceae bacterium]|jgi:AraC-like DNA-binding protein
MGIEASTLTAAPAHLAAAPPTPLLAALERLRLDGAIFFRAEFTESWALHSPLRDMTGVIRPGAERLILFHIVAAGRCWVEVERGERHWASRGDVIVLPYGDDYVMGGVGPAEHVPLVTLMALPPWETMPVLVHGQGGERTDVVCGYLHSEDPLFDPGLRAFPPAFVVTLPEGPAKTWVAAGIEFALATTSRTLPTEAVSTRLPELLLIEVLRVHLADAPATDHGWVAALRDPVLAPAMAAMHAEPGRKWTVTSLATAVTVSRSVLDERFRTVLGRSPIRYLTEWRMHVAADLLTATDLSVAAVSRRVGYESEEAFSRAFKRARGSSPGAWRTAERAPVSSAAPLP